MSKLLEYLKLLPKGLSNPSEVVEGIKNTVELKFGTLPEDQKEEILRRRIICKGCEYMSENARAAGKLNSKRTEDFCTLCSCPILTKTASLSSNCGIKTYNERNNTNLPLKWEAYESG